MPDKQAQASSPAAAAADVPLEAFDSFASRHRRRATLDGAWRVEVSERVQAGAVTRSVTSWHDRAQPQPLPPRQKPQQQHDMPQRRKQPTRRALGTQTSRPNSKQQRSALRSAAHHRKQRARALRRVLLAVLASVRWWRAMMVALALRDAPVGATSPASPGKRRLSAETLDGEAAPEVSDAASPPQPKRAAPSAPPPRSPSGNPGLRAGFLLGP